MRTSLSWATLGFTVLIVGMLAPGAQSQQPAGANATRFGVAVVDVTYIFKNHQRFKAMTDQMRGDVQKAEDALREERQRIANMEEQLKTFKAGTPEYKRLDEQITEQKANFNLEATRQRKDFLEREAQIYYQAYLEVQDAVKYYAQANNIGIVLRFNGDPIEPGKREEVLRGINKAVVFQNGIDITPDILRAVNRGGAPVVPGGNRISNPIPGQPLR